MRTRTAPSPAHWALSASLALAALGAAGCVPDGAPDGGDGDDAGVEDAGPEYPPYEVEEGWYPEDGHWRHPSRCGAAPYRWWGVAELGDLLTVQPKHDMSLELLQGIKNTLANQVIMSREPTSPAKVFRVQYVTQDRGSLTDATGLVGWPVLGASAEVPVLLFLHGTTGFHDDCTPSSNIDGFLDENYYNAAIVGLIASWGYLVVAPDYLGLRSIGQSDDLHPYFVAEPTALSSLDAVRAAQKLVATEAPDVIPGRVLSMGVSQGGHASAFVVRYAPHYAPELDVAAAIYNVPPLDLVAESEAALESPTPTTQGNAAVVLAAADRWYASAPNRLLDVLLPTTEQQIVEHMETRCNLPDLPGDPTTLFTPALLSGDIEPWRCYGEENSLTETSVPRLDDVPALVVLAENDELVNTPIERQSVGQLCAEGLKLQLLECEGASHTEGFFYSLDDMFDFLEARLAGEPMPADACDIRPAQKCASDPRP